jgi:hypothetical protein
VLVNGKSLCPINAGICCGLCFFANLKSHYEKFESEPLITLQLEAVVVLA